MVEGGALMKEQLFGVGTAGLALEEEVAAVVRKTVRGTLTVRDTGTKAMLVGTRLAVDGNHWVDCRYVGHMDSFAVVAVEEAALSFVEIEIVQFVAGGNFVVFADCFGIGYRCFLAASFFARLLFSCFLPRVLFRRHCNKLRWGRQSLRRIY